MRSSVLVLAILLGCSRSAPPPPCDCFGWGPDDSHAPERTSCRARQTTGALFVLDGTAFRQPVRVPLWVELSTDGGDDTHLAFNEWFFFATSADRIYIGQHNAWAGLGDACRLLDVASGRFEEVSSGCITPDSGLHYRARSLGGDWIEIVSDSEGASTVELARWSPRHGKRVELAIDGNGFVDARLDDAGGIVIVTQCDPIARGCAPAMDPAPLPRRRYRWSKATGLARDD